MKKFQRIYDKHDLKNYPGNIFNCDESRFQPFFYKKQKFNDFLI